MVDWTGHAMITGKVMIGKPFIAGWDKPITALAKICFLR
jgi:hypothetical protein